jgi:hypothetical protein
MNARNSRDKGTQHRNANSTKNVSNSREASKSCNIRNEREPEIAGMQETAVTPETNNIKDESNITW